MTTVHHEHGAYHGGDNWDAECCICPGSPCEAVTVADMVRHAEYDRKQSESQRPLRVLAEDEWPQ